MRKGMCFHFNGTQNDECEAGINIRKLVGGKDLGWATRTPCFRKNESNRCDKYLEPTEKQIADELQEMEQRQGGIIEAIALIIEKTKASPTFGPDMDSNKSGGSGFIDCPVCGGPLSYTIAGGNNHIWGQCSKVGCLEWMM